MRLAFVTTSLEPGGAETALTRLVVGLVSEGAHATVMSLHGKGRLVEKLRDHGVSVTAFGQASALGLSTQLPRMARDLRSFRPDIIQGWMYHGNLISMAIRPYCNGKLWWAVRQSLGAPDRERTSTNRLIRLSARLSRRPRGIVYNSERARTDHEGVGYSRQRGVVVPNGFDAYTLTLDPIERRRVRSELGVAANAIVIGHIARYHPVKDHDTFLQAAAEVGQTVPDAQFVMAGRGVDSSNHELTTSIARLGLERKVTLLGELDDIGMLLPGLDALCLSSRSEAFPNVIGEAMCFSIPCVTTDVGDAALIIGDTGVVVPVGHSARLAEGLRFIARLEPEERARKGHAARARVESHFSQASVTRAYVRLYETSMNES